MGQIVQLNPPLHTVRIQASYRTVTTHTTTNPLLESSTTNISLLLNTRDTGSNMCGLCWTCTQNCYTMHIFVGYTAHCTLHTD